MLSYLVELVLELILELRRKRAIWVREIQPELLAGEPVVQLCRLGFHVVFACLVNWQSDRSHEAALLLSCATGLCLARYFWCRHRPEQYGSWRWLLVTIQKLVTAIGLGNVSHLLASPAAGPLGYIKNLLLASGIALAAQMGLWDKETWLIGAPCNLVAVMILCYHGDQLCRHGLVANEYCTSITRVLFRSLGMWNNWVATVVRPFESDALVSVPPLPVAAKDVPACLCLVHTLLFSFSFFFSNVLLYLFEEHLLRERGRPPHGGLWEQAPAGVQHEDLGPAWWVYGRMLLQASVATIVLGLFVWVAARALHGV